MLIGVDIHLQQFVSGGGKDDRLGDDASHGGESGFIHRLCGEGSRGCSVSVCLVGLRCMEVPTPVNETGFRTVKTLQRESRHSIIPFG